MRARPSRDLAVVVALLVALTAGVAAAGPSRRASRSPQQVDVVGASAVCPDLRYRQGLISTRVSVGVEPPRPGAKATGGRIETVPVVDPGALTPVPITAPGQVATGLGTTLDSNALQVFASGALAAGLEVEQVTRSVFPRARGLAGVRCEPPRAEAWFVGGGAAHDDAAVIILANVEDTPATVDVSELSLTGPVDPRAGQGLTVAPHSRLVVPLDTLAPDRAFLAVHVASRRGRVVAALLHTRFEAPYPRGFDWVPQQTGPRASVFVPGFPAGPGGRLLVVANPGTDDTTVRVQVTTGDGQFVPSGMDEVPVAAGSTTVVDLSRLALDGPLGARVTSDGGPVLAGGMLNDVQPGQPIRDFGYTAATGPLTGAAVLTDLVINRPTESTLVLSAPEGAASVEVRPLRVLGTRGAPPAPRVVQIPAQRTVAFRLSTFFPPGTQTLLAVQVRLRAGSGPVYAARYLREHGAHGPLTSALVLQGPAQQVPRPRVAEDPQVAYP